MGTNVVLAVQDSQLLVHAHVTGVKIQLGRSGLVRRELFDTLELLLMPDEMGAKMGSRVAQWSLVTNLWGEGHTERSQTKYQS